MGLFDRLINKQKTETTYQFVPVNENGAIVALLMTIINSDGEASEVETDLLLKILVFKNWMRGEDIMEYYRPAFYALQNSSPNVLIDVAAPLISEERKLTVFALCCDLAFVDGILAEQEKEVIDYVANALQIDEDTALKILQVMLIKNADNMVIVD